MNKELEQLIEETDISSWYTLPHGMKEVLGRNFESHYIARQENIRELVKQAFALGQKDIRERVEKIDEDNSAFIGDSGYSMGKVDGFNEALKLIKEKIK